MTEPALAKNGSAAMRRAARWTCVEGMPYRCMFLAGVLCLQPSCRWLDGVVCRHATVTGQEQLGGPACYRQPATWSKWSLYLTRSGVATGANHLPDGCISLAKNVELCGACWELSGEGAV